jgi:hypothetical protein
MNENNASNPANKPKSPDDANKENLTTNQPVKSNTTPQKRPELATEKSPARTPFANKSNHSILLDSMDTRDDEQTANMTSNNPNMSITRTAAHKLPPAAEDILGVSYASASADSINVSYMPSGTPRLPAWKPKQLPLTKPSPAKPKSATVNNKAAEATDDEAVFKVPTTDALGNPSNNSGKSNSLETQLLTDSELFAIDNLCKDMYSVHNQTIDGNCSILESASVVSAKRQEHRIEFVCSLLKPDKKVKEFYKLNKD